MAIANGFETLMINTSTKNKFREMKAKLEKDLGDFALPYTELASSSSQPDLKVTKFAPNIALLPIILFSLYCTNCSVLISHLRVERLCPFNVYL